jgi:hypothetical protein
LATNPVEKVLANIGAKFYPGRITGPKPPFYAPHTTRFYGQGGVIVGPFMYTYQALPSGQLSRNDAIPVMELPGITMIKSIDCVVLSRTPGGAFGIDVRLWQGPVNFVNLTEGVQNPSNVESLKGLVTRASGPYMTMRPTTIRISRSSFTTYFPKQIGTAIVCLWFDLHFNLVEEAVNLINDFQELES